MLRYYEIDDIVIREFLGKKLSSKHRKDLDEVVEKTHISIKSCRYINLNINQKLLAHIKNIYLNKTKCNYNFRRQFDNVKRIFKAVEEMQGSIIKNISNLFLLSEDLAKY